ncbi:MAG: hypothetical protein MUF59_10090 [Candidatus Krumholzibacteria bacterium]|nr:hypothetical protein [Candidatus Krumholzibacteria bacterium]
MQCILREKLLEQATKLADVSNIYRADSHRFVEAYFAWLEDAGKDLAGLKCPLGILLQAEKSSLNSVSDGYVPDNIQNGKNLRKIQKAAAARSLERVSKEIYLKIEGIDHVLEELSEKLCNAVAVLVTKEPEVCEKLEPNRQGIDFMPCERIIGREARLNIDNNRKSEDQ